jgi:lactate dehydrogenase-like 2-hydroxyacid dehydrogenase
LAKPEILITRPFYAPAMAHLDREFTTHKLWLASDPRGLLGELAGRLRVVVTTGLVGFSPQEMDALPHLELIACYGNPHSGMVDLAAARARGVSVTNTPDSITQTVADLALGILISTMRRITEGDRFVRAGGWLQGPLQPGRELGGKVCGIVGLGRIGRAIARRVEVCGMSVCYHGPHRKEDVGYRYYADLEAMAREIDCLVVMCPLTPATRNLVSPRVIAALRPESFLVNIARGPVVNQEALISALREKRIAGAGLDVFWDEPQVPAELMAMDNVVLSPHLGSATLEIRDERGRKLLENLRAYFAGQPLPHRMLGNTAGSGGA